VHHHIQLLFLFLSFFKFKLGLNQDPSRSICFLNLLNHRFSFITGFFPCAFFVEKTSAFICQQYEFCWLCPQGDHYHIPFLLLSPINIRSGTVLTSRTFCKDEYILYLCWGHLAFEVWLLWLRNWEIFNLNKF
jgi:hypothetical protein